jgi:hypothetical protein
LTPPGPRFPKFSTAGRSESTVFSHRGSSRFSVIDSRTYDFRSSDQQCLLFCCRQPVVERSSMSACNRNSCDISRLGIQEMEDYRLAPLSIPCMSLAGMESQYSTPAKPRCFYKLESSIAEAEKRFSGWIPPPTSEFRSLMCGKLAVFRANRHTNTVFVIMTSVTMSERKSSEPLKCFAKRPHRQVQVASSSRVLLLCSHVITSRFTIVWAVRGFDDVLNGKSQIRQFLAQRGCLAHGYANSACFAR